MVSQNRLLAGASLVPLALAVGSQAAAADPPEWNYDAGGRAVTLVPDPPPKRMGKDGASAFGPVTPGRSYKCVESGTLRRAPGSYVMGWCMAGMHIDISSSPSGEWQKGWAHGNYEHCGWFMITHPLTPSGTYDHNCGSHSYSETHFASRLNTEGFDNRVTPVKNNCPLYANVRPWDESNHTGYNQVGTLPQVHRVFNWRYKSRNGAWVLGRVENGGYYDWAFVHSSCVPDPPHTRAPQNDFPNG
jgi:hypothetical protein